MEADDTKEQIIPDLAIQEILDEFQTIFDELSGLPPSKGYDHQIKLHDAAKPTCVRPYRYPYYQKEEIEKLVKKMLQARIIQTSQSLLTSFASEKSIWELAHVY